jgi:hypothetical protein
VDTYVCRLEVAMEPAVTVEKLHTFQSIVEKLHDIAGDGTRRCKLVISYLLSR